MDHGIDKPERSKLKKKRYSINHYLDPVVDYLPFQERLINFLVYIFAFTAVVACLIYYFPKSDEICYSRVGCFTLSGPWATRPTIFNFSPQSPSVINTTFIVASRREPNGKFETAIYNDELRNLDAFPWGESDTIIFIVHGYTDDTTTWMRSLKDAFLQLADVTVILVDWRSGAAGYYPQVVANTRVVAREIHIFINHIRQFWKFPKQIHLVGHSLGSHISSYVGKARTKLKVYQITALDPAFPLFEDCPEYIRLHGTDAQHVVVIHSNIGPWGLGMKNPVGTVDIYLNNGRDQRGCTQMTSIIKQPLNHGMESLANIKDMVACSHRRAYEVLEDILRSLQTSLPTPGFVAYPIKYYEQQRLVQHSFCVERNDNCWKLEWDHGTFFKLPHHQFNNVAHFLLPTTDKIPYCAQFALLEMKTCPGGMPNWDDVHIFYGAFGEEISIYSGKLFGKEVIDFWIEFPCDAFLQEKAVFTVMLSVVNGKVGSNQAAADNRKLVCVYKSTLKYFSARRNSVISLNSTSNDHLEVLVNSCGIITFVDE